MLKQKIKSFKNGGFTLVELSIVIIIIGFLIAGISAASSMIKNAEILSVIDVQRNLQTAISTFYSRFGALPGDINVASSYWASATCVAGDINVGSGCDGNLDGKIAGVVGSANATAEGTLVFQHLSLAGLIPGNQYAGGSPLFLLGVNVFPTRIKGTGYNVQWTTQFMGPALYNNVGNYLFLSAAYNNGQPGANALLPGQAAQIDKKIDDGYPSTGETLTYTGYENPVISPCLVLDANNVLQYDPTSDSLGKLCVTAHKIEVGN